MFLSRGDISLMGCLFGVKTTKPNILALNAYAGTPSSSLLTETCALQRTDRPQALPPAYVVLILLRRCFAQIAKTVIVFDAVDVVDLFNRPPLVSCEPRETMGEIKPPACFYLAVSIFIKEARDVTSSDAPSINAPFNNSCIWIVIEKS